MHVQLITFGLNGITEEEFAEASETKAPAFTSLPGLLCKIWLRDPETNTYGGLYLWRDRESCERYVSGEIFEAIRSDGNLKDFASRELGVFEVLTKMTQPGLEVI